MGRDEKMCVETEEELRQAELAKYKICYENDPTYKMGRERMLDAREVLSRQPYRGSYLDVGCGRGEMLDYARRDLKFRKTHGTETVEGLMIMGMLTIATVDNLPFHDSEFEVVSMFDVIEHLNEFDIERGCKELYRVAEKVLIITASNVSSIEQGMELHITRKPYDEWDTFFRSVFPGEVIWCKDLSNRINETWMIKK